MRLGSTGVHIYHTPLAYRVQWALGTCKHSTTICCSVAPLLRRLPNVCSIAQGIRVPVTAHTALRVVLVLQAGCNPCASILGRLFTCVTWYSNMQAPGVRGYRRTVVNAAPRFYWYTYSVVALLPLVQV